MANKIAFFVKNTNIVLDTSIENKLLTVISTNSPKQEEESFKAFIDLLKKRAKEFNIKEFTIFHSAWLHRHYIPLANSNLQDSEIIEEIRTIQENWINDNIDPLNTVFLNELGEIQEDSRDKSEKRHDKKLQEYIVTDYGYKIKINIISFDEILEKTQSLSYKEAREKVQSLYDDENNHEFRSLVDKHSKEYYGKKLFDKYIDANKDKDPILFQKECDEAAVKYVLDECALVAIFKELRCTHLSYPGKKNPCFEFFQNIYSKLKGFILKFLEYTVKGVSNKLNKSEEKNDTEISGNEKEKYIKKSSQNIEFLIKLIDDIPKEDLLEFEVNFKDFLGKSLKEVESNRLNFTHNFFKIEKNPTHRKLSEENLKKHLPSYFLKITKELSFEQLSSLREKIVAEFSHRPEEVIAYGK